MDKYMCVIVNDYFFSHYGKYKLIHINISFNAINFTLKGIEHMINYLLNNEPSYFYKKRCVFIKIDEEYNENLYESSKIFMGRKKNIVIIPPRNLNRIKSARK